ncbi:immunoglobulin-like domain-containing protein [Lactimicrobium massiliense]|uniref:immunoglobulin-like domain-containing protein n=1 Tax=Lactimicrobium massiliense TaxID=2161814 RepID=UPI000D55C0FE|nr:transglutaminase domain-containing protein [Lactimicrobium massiliense]
MGKQYSRRKSTIAVAVIGGVLVLITILIRKGVPTYIRLRYFNRVKPEVTIEAGSQLDPSMFMKDGYQGFVSDEGDEYNTKTPGTYHVKIESGNYLYPTVLKITDTTPPVITGNNFECTAGDTISYKKQVTVTDNSGDDVDIQVDSSAVDIDTPGTYPIIYTAADSSGNTSSITLQLTVDKKIPTTPQEINDAMADDILTELDISSMSDREKITAIGNWVYYNIRYAEKHVETNPPVSEVYLGLYYRVGDCYVACYTAQELLNRAGIENMVVHRLDTYGLGPHLWLIVNIGDGWYHLDCMRGRPDGTIFIYVPTSTLAVYDQTHPGYYQFDPSLYPDITD